MSTISFAEVIQGRRAVVPVTDDGFLHAVDLVVVMTGKDRDQAGNVLRRLVQKSLYLSTKLPTRTLSTRGGYPTKLVGFKDAIELIMVLPGKTAKHVRKKFSDIISRYLDGDRSMCHEIEVNHTSGKAKSYSKFASGIMMRVDNENYKQTFQEMPSTSYVYVTKSMAFPGLVKIGKTVDIASRLSALNTSCSPMPHVIVAVAPTFDSDRDEKIAHMFFSKARREGEFFELSDAEVISYFAMHITAQYNADLANHTARLQGLLSAQKSVS